MVEWGGNWSRQLGCQLGRQLGGQLGHTVNVACFLYTINGKYNATFGLYIMPCIGLDASLSCGALSLVISLLLHVMVPA